MMSSRLILLTFALGRTPFKTFDPFLFCVYHNDEYPAGNENMGPDPKLLLNRPIGSDFSYQDGWSMYHGETVPGFPSHPHRGFETITVTQQGLVDHSDSIGLTARYGNGDTQWMTAGGGIQHCEMFPLVNQKGRNPLQLFQIWLNLPKKDKMVSPAFSMFWAEEQPTASATDEQGKTTKVRVIAGNYRDTQALPPTQNSWAAEPSHHVNIWVVDIPENGTFEFPAAPTASVNRALYFVEGHSIAISTESKSIGVRTGLQLDPTKSFSVRALHQPAQLLLLQGEPINEPVRQHGPFVMNTHEEILSAFEDYRRTQFGGWPWPSSDHMHSRETKRHAKYPDGSIIKPSETPAAES